MVLCIIVHLVIVEANIPLSICVSPCGVVCPVGLQGFGIYTIPRLVCGLVAPKHQCLDKCIVANIGPLQEIGLKIGRSPVYITIRTYYGETSCHFKMVI